MSVEPRVVDHAGFFMIRRQVAWEALLLDVEQQPDPE